MDFNALLAGIWDAPAIVIMRNILGIATLTWLSVQTLPDGFRLGKIGKPGLSAIAGPLITMLLYLVGIVKMPMEMAEDYLIKGGVAGAVVRLCAVLALGLVATGLAKWFHDWKFPPPPDGLTAPTKAGP